MTTPLTPRNPEADCFWLGAPADPDTLGERIKDAITTYDAVIFICSECGRLAYMIDPGDGLITHLEDDPSKTEKAS